MATKRGANHGGAHGERPGPASMPAAKRAAEPPGRRAVVRVKGVRGIPAKVVAAYGDEDELLFIAPVEKGAVEVELPEAYVGRPIRVVYAPADEHVERPTLARMRRAMAFEDKLILRPETRLAIDPDLLVQRWRRSCCWVRGRVVVNVRLPDGSTQERPLCNGRVVICEVDRSFGHLVRQLPNEVLFRLRDDIVRAIADPAPDPMAPPVDRVLRDGVRVAVERYSHAVGLEQPDDPVASLRALHGPIGDAALRTTLVDLADLLRPYWRCLDWLTPYYDVDCIAVVDVAEDGTFETEITYPCRGDRPDLYFKVEQDCHPKGWRTVHAPPVHCNVHWDYCCGTSVKIEVSHPAAMPGRSPVPCTWPHIAGDPASVGSWTTLSHSSGVFVVHAALLRTGKVLMFSGTAEDNLPKQSRVWDPVTGTMTAQSFGDDLFCAGHCQLPDGRILVNGGSNNPGQGIRSTHIFDPASETWAKVRDMAYPRWYPTTLTLPDGRAITFSGRGGEAKVEVYDPGADTWTELVVGTPRALDIYPSLHLMPDGKIFYTGTRWAGSPAWPSPSVTALFDPAAGVWSDVDDHVVPNRTEAMAVLLPPLAPAPVVHEHADVPKRPATRPSLTRVLVVGGSGDNPGDSRSAEVIDLAGPGPTWRRIADLSASRVNTNAVLLPDGNVLVCSGIDGYKWGPNSPSLAAELLDPNTETWTVMAAMSAMRQYHSVSILLPDGRVLCTGSVGPGGNNTTMEVYSPPYLYRGPRPMVSACPTAVGHGQSFVVSSPAACRIDRVAMVRCASITHHTDTDQRYLPLDFTRQGRCDLTLTSPADANVAPPGYYLLFLIDDCGVPSVGRFVRIP